MNSMDNNVDMSKPLFDGGGDGGNSMGNDDGGL